MLHLHTGKLVDAGDEVHLMHALEIDPAQQSVLVLARPQQSEEEVRRVEEAKNHYYGQIVGDSVVTAKRSSGGSGNGENHHFVMEDQNGKSVNMAANDREALQQGMLLHQKGRLALQRGFVPLSPVTAATDAGASIPSSIPSGNAMATEASGGIVADAAVVTPADTPMADAPPAPPADAVDIKIKMLSGKLITVRGGGSESIAVIKRRVCDSKRATDGADAAGLTPAAVKLIFNNKV
jgi:hypothetical protein